MLINNIGPIVSPKWLNNQLNKPNIIIVDCRFRLDNPPWGYQQYLLSHIPGAHYLDLNQDLSSPVEKHGGRHPLPDIEILAAKLASLGIGSDTLVIAYDDSRLAFAARLWWLLRYLGHQHVALLDGGFNAWLGLAYPVDDLIPAKEPQVFIPNPQLETIVDIDYLKLVSTSADVILIDSRESDRYRGEREPIDPIAGHIPSAVNSPWTKVSDSSGYLLSQSEQKQLWSSYQQTKEIIVYCGSGVTACVNLFSLQLAGISHAKLYPGGWSDWCSYLF